MFGLLGLRPRLSEHLVRYDLLLLPYFPLLYLLFTSARSRIYFDDLDLLLGLMLL